MLIYIFCSTLYCAKGNYEFGISRVIKSLEPQNNKLSADTWNYVKRCLLSMAENLAMHTLVLRDAVLLECMHFLEMCEGNFVLIIFNTHFECLVGEKH